MNQKTYPEFRLCFPIVIAVFALLASVPGLSGQQAKTTGASADTASLEAKIDRFIAPYLAMNDMSGSILISRDDKVAYEKSFGVADVKTHKPNTPQTRFCLGSLNKQLTSAAILILEEQGKLKTG